MSDININSPVNHDTVRKENYQVQNTENYPVQDNTNSVDLQKNFLNLLITQIQNQDPTNPLKNSDLTSQLAQINTATGMEKLNNTLFYMLSQTNQSQNFQLSSLIGHHIMASNKNIIRMQDAHTRFKIKLSQYATSVEVKITDEDNKVLYLKNMQNVKSGSYNFVWNGKDLHNKNIKNGKYNIIVTAKNKDESVPVKTFSEAVVNSIIIAADNNPLLNLEEAGKIKPQDVREILT